MSASKTNAMRILDGQHIQYNILSYDHQDGKIDGMNVAEKIERAPEMVFKTLVAHGKQNLFVFVIPVHKELDLKKAAKSAGEKKIEMLPVKDLQKYTGYIRGGCSPIGMKKLYPTFIDQPALELEAIVVSGGKIGTQLELSPHDLALIIQAQFTDLTHTA
ncbi:MULTISPECIES: Cys-tRNA(Pro) deacylase [Paenibacillus]|jgi:Cys-tRNA(Pro)/Cys-tRNA(Cys) deacylase|uniref:Cys-tRNA(Pro)/Cys-tRNA(Cys) deacylase n=2 Tax=Paenibacillus TaxID=44249 RepID=A0ABX2ZH29_PAEPO|nr:MULTISPECIES: Cys-tRNA(Pro) deacylase [Paenibacillus]AHC19913.1 cysteinyl-tRNA(Pro) deacylase [Paenibacillus polymyxa CR1]ALA42161.1 cysteinyl-tRNA(Pro) deacylase [Paenibacillus peoriae]APB76113.1 Cys-tRNA(Pro) deacylase [Paenibacillus polymyxa]APQ59352.1 cysteinyl-tRNA(Pro) deacylase [Paenibacillus polymyxa]MCP3747586.1 Cys-tRNA(Pro) deacylase [Paenibacillus sp. A3M_27_13]